MITNKTKSNNLKSHEVTQQYDKMEGTKLFSPVLVLPEAKVDFLVRKPKTFPCLPLHKLKTAGT